MLLIGVAVLQLTHLLVGLMQHAVTQSEYE